MRRAHPRLLAAVTAPLLLLGLTTAVSASDAPQHGSGPVVASPAADQQPTGAGTSDRPNKPDHSNKPKDPKDPDLEVPEPGWYAGSTGIGGTARYDDGEWVHQDFVYDDGERADNAADIVEVRARADDDDLVVRVTLNTLRDHDTPVLGLALGSPGGEPVDWPNGAGVSSPWERFVTVLPNGDSAVLTTSDGDTTLATPTVDLDANTVELIVPGAAADDPVLRLTAGAGLWGDTSWTSAGVIDLAFNSHDQEPSGDNFRDVAQGAAISSGDVSAMHQDLDVTSLRDGKVEGPVREPGLYNAVFESRQDLGGGYASGFPTYRGKYQPYALWIPAGVDLDEPTPLILILHSLGQIHNQYNSRTMYHQMGDGLGAVAITPLALGTGGWYLDEALVDTLEAWVDVTGRFTIDPERTYSSGYSMGGYGTYRLGTLLPELLAAGVSWVGPPTNGIWTGSPTTNDPGLTYHQLENTNHVPFFIVHGTNDELVPVLGVTRQAERFKELGHEYRYALHPGQEHFSFAILDDWSRERTWVHGRRRVTDPARVTFKVRPHTWATPSGERFVATIGHLRDLATELGAALDGAYWVQDVVADGDGDVTGEVDLTSHAVRNRVPELTEVMAVAVPGSSPHVLTGQDRTFLPVTPENRLSGTLSGVASLTVDLASTGLPLGVELDITTDVPVTITLVLGHRQRTVDLEPDS